MSRIALATAALLAAGCSSSPATRESTGGTKQAVISGKDSDASQDGVVLLVHYDPSTRGVGSCTGSLVAPNLVLTARHCVADTDQTSACAVDGTPLAAGAVRGNHKADTLYVFTGKDRPDFHSGQVKPDAQGKRIVDDGSTNLCNHDIALVVLGTPVENAKIMPIRLDGDPVKGETFTAVGWGVVDSSGEPDVRQQRTGIKVESIGPDDSAPSPTPPNEFQVGESICVGDSGGPAIAKSGAIIGVVSRGGNYQRPSTSDPSASCVGAENFYTKLAPFKELIMKGFELASAEPWIEDGPDPRRLKPGSACTDGSECLSNLCVAGPAQKGATTCADDCSQADCPEGHVCHAEGDARICRDPETLKNNVTTTTTTGCRAAPGGTGGGVSALALAAVALASLRRRRRVC